MTGKVDDMVISKLGFEGDLFYAINLLDILASAHKM